MSSLLVYLYISPPLAFFFFGSKDSYHYPSLQAFHIFLKTNLGIHINIIFHLFDTILNIFPYYKVFHY